MNRSSEHIMLQRIIFISIALLFLFAIWAGSRSLITSDPETITSGKDLTQEIVQPGSNASDSDASNPDTPSVTDVGSDDANSAESETDSDEIDSDTEYVITPQMREALNIFWNDSVFVGDSVTLGLRNYVTKQRNNGVECLGEAQFLAVGNMSYTNTLPEIGSRDAYHPKYQGKTVTIEEGVRLTGAKHVFILLGMNDFAAYPTETGLKSATEVVARIKELNPNVDIYIESVTPTLHNHKVFNNDNIDLFNEQMKQLCGEKGWTYVDIASVMKDENGLFKSEYCSDPEKEGVHMEAEGCVAWIDYLERFIANGGKTK